MRVRTGTSGFSYKEWKGRFYPEDLPASRMLAFYATRFPSVEINNTFYRMPKAELLTQWGEQVGPEFVFALKAPRTLTHIKRLKGAGDATRRFLERASVLGPRLGPVLFQLPPNFKKDLKRLQRFLRTVPKRIHAAFEFRHNSWFEDDVLDALRSAGAALCIAEDEALSTPWAVTGDFGYLRLRKPAYTPAKLATWAKRIRETKWAETYVFFKHEDEARGPKLAAQFAKAFA